MHSALNSLTWDLGEITIDLCLVFYTNGIGPANTQRDICESQFMVLSQNATISHAYVFMVFWFIYVHLCKNVTAGCFTFLPLVSRWLSLKVTSTWSRPERDELRRLGNMFFFCFFFVTLHPKIINTARCHIIRGKKYPKTSSPNVSNSGNSDIVNTITSIFIQASEAQTKKDYKLNFACSVSAVYTQTH